MRLLKAGGVILVLLVLPAVLARVYLVHPTAQEILTRMAAAYQSARWYSATTTVESSVLSDPASYEIAYERPHKLRVQFHGILEDQTIVCDGLSVYRHLPGLKQYTISPAPERIGSDLPEEQPMLTLALLNGEMDLRGPARYLRRSEADGTEVYVVRLQRLAAEEGGAILPEMVIWVGAEDYLARRLETKLPVGDAALAHTLIHRGVSVEPIPAQTFRFSPPDDARPVADFEREPIELDADFPLPPLAGEGLEP